MTVTGRGDAHPIRVPAPPDGRLGLCHRDEVTHSIAIAYSFLCNLFPSSDPSFVIRCPRALKTLCGRLDIVDRRDDHALIRRCGAPSPPPPVSPNDDRASARHAYAWPADRGTREPNRRARRAYTSAGVRACSAAGTEPHATLDDAGTAETLLIQWQWWRRIHHTTPLHLLFAVVYIDTTAVYPTFIPTWRADLARKANRRSWLRHR